MEIALIKLCRPAMETNLDSVLDRLRVLEQRMDERPVQQVIVQQGSGKMPAETGAVQEPAETKHRRKLHRKICRRLWQAESDHRTDDRDVQADASEICSEV